MWDYTTYLISEIWDDPVVQGILRSSSSCPFLFQACQSPSLQSFLTAILTAKSTVACWFGLSDCRDDHLHGHTCFPFKSSLLAICFFRDKLWLRTGVMHSKVKRVIRGLRYSYRTKKWVDQSIKLCLESSCVCLYEES